jgi:hypothetical protein
MSEQPEGQYPSPEQYVQAAQAAGTAVPYAQAAEQAADEVVDPTSQGTDAGPAIDQIREQVTREVLLPMEKQIQQMMDGIKADQDARQQALEAQIAQLTAQLKSAQAEIGPPAFLRYADSAAQRVRSIAAANPNLGQGHFAAVTAAADALAAKARDVAEGNAPAADLEKAAAPVERFFARHPSWIEGGGTLVAELGHLADEAAKIAA